jgi:hypothetical protein
VTHESIAEGPITRRRLLAALGGGAVLAAFNATVRPGTARATNGDYVQVGQTAVGTVETVVKSTGGGTALKGWTTHATGTGVHGLSDNYFGVIGTGAVGGVAGTSEGTGVQGLSSAGTGLYGLSTTGLALDVDGAARFKTSGIAQVKAGKSSKTVDPGIDINGKSKILCTLLGNPGNAAVIKWVNPLVGKDKFKLYLTQAVAVNTDFAWFVIS